MIHVNQYTDSKSNITFKLYYYILRMLWNRELEKHIFGMSYIVYEN